jgi:hypothetical protein
VDVPVVYFSEHELSLVSSCLRKWGFLLEPAIRIDHAVGGELSEILMTRIVTSRITALSESFTLSLPIDNPRHFCLGLYSGESDLTSQGMLDLFLASMFNVLTD